MKKTTETLTAEKNRYSDEELEEFKQIILKKLEKALEDLKELTSLTINEHDISGTSQTSEIVELASESYLRDENFKFVLRLTSFVRELEEALFRIGVKTYGICRISGRLIPKDRLRRVPHTTTTIEAKKSEMITKVVEIPNDTDLE